MIDARYFVVPRSDLRLGRICGALRDFLYAGKGGGEAEVYARRVLRLARRLGRINAQAIRLIRVARAKGVVLIDLAPCDFELELGAAGHAVYDSNAVRCAWEALCLDNGIGISQDIGRIGLVYIIVPFPAYYDDDKDGDGAALLLLDRPIRNNDTIVGLACLVDGANVRGGAFEHYHFANVGIDRGASVADRLWVLLYRFLGLLW